MDFAGKRRSFWSAFVLFSLSLISCTTTKVIPVAATNGPLRAELIVREFHTTPCVTLYGGSCGYQEASIVLHRGFSDRYLPYGCYATKAGVPDAQIVTSTGESGERIAFRCTKSESWRVIFVGSGNRSFLDCREYKATGDFSWDGVDGLREASPPMIERGCNGVLLEDVAAEIQAVHGVASVTDLLIATISMQATRKISKDFLQAWDDAYVKLPAGEKKRLVPVFRAAIFGQSQVMLRAIAKADAKEAARLGCAELEREMKRGAIVYLAGAVLAVANAAYQCPVVLATLENSSCTANYYCGSGRICEAKELSADIKKALSQPTSPLDFIARDHALLAAALAHPGSHEILKLWHQRHSYVIDQPREPSCEQLYIMGKKGVPCHCFTDVPASACAKNHTELTCSFRVDDTAKRIDQVVSP
ncbi:MAG: hypothetical protein HY042_05660 [Spirochaetia bacterium]|nr:hypothetical protein [Spirochaetia bacterium]